MTELINKLEALASLLKAVDTKALADAVIDVSIALKNKPSSYSEEATSEPAPEEVPSPTETELKTEPEPKAPTKPYTLAYARACALALRAHGDGSSLAKLLGKMECSSINVMNDTQIGVFCKNTENFAKREGFEIKE